jgi:hypothetical protein
MLIHRQNSHEPRGRRCTGRRELVKWVKIFPVYPKIQLQWGTCLGTCRNRFSTPSKTVNTICVNWVLWRVPLRQTSYDKYVETRDFVLIHTAQDTDKLWGKCNIFSYSPYTTAALCFMNTSEEMRVTFLLRNEVRIIKLRLQNLHSFRGENTRFHNTKSPYRGSRNFVKQK